MNIHRAWISSGSINYQVWVSFTYKPGDVFILPYKVTSQILHQLIADHSKRIRVTRL